MVLLAVTAKCTFLLLQLLTYPVPSFQSPLFDEDVVDVTIQAQEYFNTDGSLSFKTDDLRQVASQLDILRQVDEDLEMTESFKFSTQMAHAILERMEVTRSVPKNVIFTVNNYYQSYKNTSENISSLDRSMMGPPSDTENCQKTHQCQVPLTLSGIWGYGCWCNFGESLTEGVGKPVSEYDEICKKMQLCLRCARIDAKQAGNKCDPKSVYYEVDFGWMQSNQAILADCTKNNPNNFCAQHVCSCELNLIHDLLNLLWDGIVYDDFYKHSSGWDPAADGRCKTKNSGNNRLKACCGTYPERAPYGGDFECCEQVQIKYNPFI